MNYRNLGVKKGVKKIVTIATAGVLLAGISSTAFSQTVVFEKRGVNFSIDGGNGAATGRQIYLWNTNNSNVNQQWDEIQIDNRFVQYRKRGTNHCIDGQSGGGRRQAVHLWPCNTNNINQHWEKIPLSGGFTRLKKRGVSFSLDCGNGGARRQTCHLWNSQDSNVNQNFRIRTVSGGSGSSSTSSTSSSSSSSSTSSTSSSSGSGSGQFGLNPNDDPWENFDLREWAIDTPAGRSGSRCRAARTEPQEWNSSFNNTDSADYFFTHSDGGMRFISVVGGATTGGSCNSRARSELREFLRGSNTSIDDTGDDGDFRNNWALGYQPSRADADFSWGAREGRMRATLAVNRVTTSGNNSNRGRTIIGQIHAKDDEPLRLNYKSIPGRSGGGCIYASSEERGGDDTNFPILGTVSCNAGDEDGRIGLNEMFSYEIENDDEDIIVTIRAGDRGTVLGSVTIDLDRIDGGYDRDDEYMYFKAGAYTQNEDNTGARDGERDIVTFYRLDVDH